MSTENDMGGRDPRDVGRSSDAGRPHPGSEHGDDFGRASSNGHESYRPHGHASGHGYPDDYRERDRARARTDADGERRSSPFAELLRPFTDLYESVSETLKRIGPLGPDVVDRLGYRAVIAYFVEHAPPAVGAMRGTLIRQPHPKGWLVSQLFLTAGGRPLMRDDDRPYGRKLIVRRFDDELEDLFGDRDMIIFD